jgi:erythromycin esterase-like protein
MARQLLNFHAASARPSDDRYARGLGIRDALQADNLAYIVERERGRGKVLAFAHNAHLQRGQAVWPWYTFWPAGAHLNAMLGPRYAVIGSAVGVSAANGIGQPETDTLEARLTALPGPALFIPTHNGQGLPEPHAVDAWLMHVMPRCCRAKPTLKMMRMMAMPRHFTSDCSRTDGAL